MKKRILDTLRSRKGMAMELALLVMFVVLALSLTLVHNANLQKNQMDKAMDRLDEIEINAVGQDVVNNYSATFQAPSGYIINKTDAGYLIICEEDSIQLTIELSGEEITKWEISEYKE